MPATNAWDETKPAGSDQISLGDDAIRQFKLDVRERAALQHYWGANQTDDGKHAEMTIKPKTTNTDLIATEANQSLTGAATNSLINMAATWNVGTATPTAVLITITDTASGAASLLLNLKVGSNNKFSVDKSGTLLLPAGSGGKAISVTNATTGISYFQNTNTGGNLIIGLENSAGGGLFTGDTAYATVIGSFNATSLWLGTNGVGRFQIDSAGQMSSVQAIAGQFGLTIQNTSANASASTFAQVTNNVSSALTMQVFPSTASPSGDVLADGARLVFGGAGGLSITTTGGSAAMRFYTGGFNLRWGINSGGDLTFGPSSHVVYSAASAPSCSGFGTGSTVAGTPSAFVITTGTGANTGGTCTFGSNFFTNVPACHISTSNTTRYPGAIQVNSTTTQVGFTMASGTGAGDVFYVICLGY